jgi:hypothetical protein
MRFGKWTVVGEAGRNVQSRRYVMVVCDCGTYKKIRFDKLLSGRSRSCGCMRSELLTTHGHCQNYERTPTYISWFCMIQRCYNPNRDYFHRYGGRGIRVCKRWHTFKNFLADLGERPEGAMLGRINHSSDYKPSNVRWE